MRHLIIGGAIALGLLAAQPASAVIEVASVVSALDGVRAQAVITNPTSVDTRGLVTTAVSIKEFRATIIVRDDVSPPRNVGGPALLLQKHSLTAAQAWGASQPNGYAGPPTNDPTPGAWQGLVWPYRDQYDYFQSGAPFADDVGTSFTDPPDVYGFLNIVGIARGGPSEPAVPPPGQNTVAWLNRGITGNGADLSNPATYFWFDLVPLAGDPSRFVRVQIIAASAVVVTKTGDTYGEMDVPVPDFQFEFIQLPEPGTAMLGLVGATGLLARRRRA